jgi:hypothetical protein
MQPREEKAPDIDHIYVFFLVTLPTPKNITLTNTPRNSIVSEITYDVIVIDLKPLDSKAFRSLGLAHSIAGWE